MAADRDRKHGDEHTGEWVVDGATGRIVRRQSISLATRVREKLADALNEGALVLDPEEADARAVVPENAPTEETAEPVPARAKRPPEPHAQPAIRDLNRERLRH